MRNVLTPIALTLVLVGCDSGAITQEITPFVPDPEPTITYRMIGTSPSSFRFAERKSLPLDVDPFTYKEDTVEVTVPFHEGFKGMFAHSKDPYRMEIWFDDQLVSSLEIEDDLTLCPSDEASCLARVSGDADIQINAALIRDYESIQIVEIHTAWSDAPNPQPDPSQAVTVAINGEVLTSAEEVCCGPRSFIRDWEFTGGPFDVTKDDVIRVTKPQGLGNVHINALIDGERWQLYYCWGYQPVDFTLNLK